MQNLVQIHCCTHSVIFNATATQYMCSLTGVSCPHWLVQWSCHCWHMYIPVHPPWLPGYVSVPQTVLVILTMVGLLSKQTLFILISLGILLGMEFLHYGNLCLIFWGTAGVFFKVAVLFYIPTSSVWGFSFFHGFSNLGNITFWLAYFTNFFWLASSMIISLLSLCFLLLPIHNAVYYVRSLQVKGTIENNRSWAIRAINFTVGKT